MEVLVEQYLIGNTCLRFLELKYRCFSLFFNVHCHHNLFIHFFKLELNHLQFVLINYQI